MLEALWYEKRKKDNVKCLLCPHSCIISEGNSGLCGIRVNRGGKLYSLNYGRITSVSLDPIEKKPLKEFYPNTDILSIGTFGCNFRCRHCQNWEISQDHAGNGSIEISSDEIVRQAEDQKKFGNIGLAYTYSEPVVWYEYVLEAAEKIRAAGMKNVIVSNGYISSGPLEELLPFLDAANIDLKAFRDETYRELFGGTLEPVRRTIEKMAGRIHLEVTSVIIPDYNDSEKEMEEEAQWLASVSPDIPLHITRYFPSYRLLKEPTPPATLMKLRETASRHLNKVYLGNI